jgi:molybdopterin converting factor small subunit
VTVTIIAFPPYRAGLGPEPIDLQILDGGTLRDVLRVLAQRSAQFEPWAAARSNEWLWGQLLVHRKGEMVRLNDPVNDGDRLELLPPIAGGSNS